MKDLEILLNGSTAAQTPIRNRLNVFIDRVRRETDITYDKIETSGKTALTEARYDDAVALFSACVKLMPDSIDAYYNLGYALLITALDKQITDQIVNNAGYPPSTDDVNSHLTLARDAFVIAYNLAKTANHDNQSKYLHKLIEVNYHLADYASIFLTVAQLRDTKVHNPETLHLIGLAYGYGENDWTSAEKYFNLALQEDAKPEGEQNPLYLLRLVESYSARDQTASAILLLRILDARLDKLESLPIKDHLLHAITVYELHDALCKGQLHNSYRNIQYTPEFDSFNKRIYKSVGREMPADMGKRGV